MGITAAEHAPGQAEGRHHKLKKRWNSNSINSKKKIETHDRYKHDRCKARPWELGDQQRKKTKRYPHMGRKKPYPQKTTGRYRRLCYSGTLLLTTLLPTSYITLRFELLALAPRRLLRRADYTSAPPSGGRVPNGIRCGLDQVFWPSNQPAPAWHSGPTPTRYFGALFSLSGAEV